MKLSPYCRMMSATSKGGRLIVFAISASACCCRGSRPGWPPEGWPLLSDVSGKDADKQWCVPAWRALAGLESYAGPHQLRAGGLPSCAARRHRGAHNFVTAKICYRYHPRYGAEVELVRYLRRGSTAVVIVRLPDGPQLAIPEWMLDSEACERLKTEAKPRISLGSLLDLRKLIDSQPSPTADSTSDRAESARGGQDAKSRETRDLATQPSIRRRRALANVTGAGAGDRAKAVGGSAARC
jgi:hypothetical protein